MRVRLGKMYGERTVFRGTFSRFGLKSAYKGPPLKTVLLINITDSSGRIVCDHLWFNFTKGFAALDLKEGDVVEFHARVKDYWKGYRGRRDDVWDKPLEKDYKLSFPTKIRKVS
jgi:hypothetical protein